MQHELGSTFIKCTQHVHTKEEATACRDAVSQPVTYLCNLPVKILETRFWSRFTPQSRIVTAVLASTHIKFSLDCNLNFP